MTIDPLDGLTTEERRKLLNDAENQRERKYIREEQCRSDSQPQESPDGGPIRNIAGEVDRYIRSVTGVFSTKDLYGELAVSGAGDRTTVRMALLRLKREGLIEKHGNRAGEYRLVENQVSEMNLLNVREESVPIWLPLDLHDCAEIHPGNIIVLTGDPNTGKTAFLLRTIRENLFNEYWRNICYFNSEMGEVELKKRLDLFNDFPFEHVKSRRFRAYERSCDFQDVVMPGEGSLNIIDFLEVGDEFYKIGSYLTAIHKKLSGAIAIIAIQKKDRNSDLPLGAQRALEKPRLVVSLKAGNPNKAKILKCKNRKTEHSLDGKEREFKLVRGCIFMPTGYPDWH